MDRSEMMALALREEYAKAKILPEFERWLKYEEMLPSHDGAKMRTIIHRPEADGEFPVILQRGCYTDMERQVMVHGEELAKRGFAYVFQYCRGTGGNEGEWVPNVNERDDGIALVAWLCSQPWCGNVGYSGSSYLALTGWAMADALPDKVKSLYLTQYGTDRYTSAYQGGLFRHDVLTAWAMGNAGFPVMADYIESCKHRPHNTVDEDLWGGRIDWYRDWIKSTKRTDEYWQQGFWQMLRDIPAKIKIPVYIGEGWYDHHLGSALKSYETLNPAAKEHTLLNIGCWNHGFQNCLEWCKAKNLQNSDTLQMLDWFVRTLKNGEKPEGKIRSYVIGADTWREWKTLPQTEPFVLKLTDAGGLDAESEQGKLEYIYDPENPVPSHGAESMLRSWNEVGSLLQPEPNWREDVVSFVSVELDRELEICGKIAVELYVSSTAPDTAFTAKVMEVFPDGKAYNIRSTIQTIAHSPGGEAYNPGEVIRLELEMWDIHWRLSSGSKLRVDVSSSDFPQYAVHSNFAGIWSEQAETRTAAQTIHFGGDTPSNVTLPIL